jgi:hypothetical protein
MKRVILNESEKSNILTKHNLIFETYDNEQEILMGFKKEFMKGSYDEIADNLEKLKEVHSWSQEEISEINQAITYLRKNNAFSEVAKNMIDKKLDEYIKVKTEMVKDMVCDTVKTHPEMATEQMKNFCSGKEEKSVEKKDEIKIDTKKEDKPEVKKVESKPTDPGSFMNPYGGGADTSPGSFMNPYGS